MKVATILPTPLLGAMPKNDYHMCLFQVVKDNPVYANYYKSLAMNKFTIMDNGAAEGVNPTPEELIEVYPLVEPNEIVLPDIVGDTTETLKRTYYAYDYYVDRDLHRKYQFMAVPQGQTFADWKQCLWEMLLLTEVTTIGVSKFVSKLFADEMGQGANVRLECVHEILLQAGELQREVQIHLLGCWDNPAEVGEISRVYGDRVRGTDSGIAYVYSRNNERIDGRTPRPDNEEIDFHKGNLKDYQMQLLFDNIRMWELLCQE